MNLNSYGEYWLTRLTLTSHLSGTVYEARISRGDRIYQYMEKCIIAERIESQTNEPIDELVVKDPNETFLSEGFFTLNAILMAQNHNDQVFAYNLSITRVQFNSIRNSKCEYVNGHWYLKLFELQIPYQAPIEIKEVDG